MGGVMDGRRCGKSTTIAEKDRPWEALRRRTSRKMHEIDGYERLGPSDEAHFRKTLDKPQVRASHVQEHLHS